MFGMVLISGTISQCLNIQKRGTNVNINKLNEVSIELQKRQKKGGQSAQRIGRIRDEKEKAYIDKVVDTIINAYFKNNHTECIIKGLVLGGPSLLKKRVREHPKYMRYLDKLTIRVVDTAEIRESTALEVYQNCIKDFASTEDLAVIEEIEEIKDMITQANDKLAFGEDEIIALLYDNMLEKVIINENLPEEQKNMINELIGNTQLIEVSNDHLKQVGIDIIGIKWY